MADDTGNGTAPKSVLPMEKLTGWDIRAADKVLGGRGSFGKAITEDDFLGIYAWVYVSELRTNPDLAWDDVLGYELGDIMEATGAVETDPTNAGTGTKSPASVGTGE